MSSANPANRRSAVTERFGAAVRATIGIEEITLVLALLLITIGLWAPCGQAALLAPGLILLFIALPERRPFISRSPGPDEKRKA